MKIWINFFILSWLAIFQSNSQIAFRSQGDELSLLKLSRKGLEVDNQAEIDGSPYLKDEFVEGTIYYENEYFKGIPVRFNAFEGLLEYRQGGTIYILDPDRRIALVTFDTSNLVVKMLPYKGIIKERYLILLDSGNINLFAKPHILFRKAEPPKALESKSTPARYINMPNIYFFSFGKDELERLPNGTKKFIAALPNHQDEIAAYIKKEKLSIKKEDELIEIVKYYNGL